MKILAIETSCDETAVAIVDDNKNILSHSLNSQVKIHQEFGGVVPEIAARSHVEVLNNLIIDCLKKANLTFLDIDAFGATCGPGLIGGVIVGMMTAKTLSSIYQKPFIAVNHLEAHVLTARLTHDVKFPFLTLLISGGHCQILLANNVNSYQKLGETIDDALGEAFDKVAQMIGLNYPGGPEVEKYAKNGNENRFKFSKPLIDGPNQQENIYNFSFSGLKTAVRREIEKLTKKEFCHFTTAQNIVLQDKYDICASFQKTVSDILINRLSNIISFLQNNSSSQVKTLVISGGVASNRYIFNALQEIAKKYEIEVIAPPISLCTDNAVMIAWNAIEKFKMGLTNDIKFKPKARWELEV